MQIYPFADSQSVASFTPRDPNPPIRDPNPPMPMGAPQDMGGMVPATDEILMQLSSLPKQCHLEEQYNITGISVSSGRKLRKYYSS
jgi:hypothetical protein